MQDNNFIQNNTYQNKKEYNIVEGFIQLALTKEGGNRFVILDIVKEWLNDIGWTQDDIDSWISKFDNYEIFEGELEELKDFSND